jgi:uncharacterized membrane protein YdjX (TVP38/TMEM64 family)
VERPTGSIALKGLRPGIKLGLFVLVIALGFGLAYHFGLFDVHYRERLQAFLRALGPWAPLAFVVIKICTVVLALPSAPVTFTGGVLFGPIWGTVINVFAATTGAMCTFFIGRLLGREAIEKRLQGKLKELDEGLTENGLAFMLFLRLVPLFPFNGINYGAGLTRVRFRDYFLGTFFGIMPGAAVFTYLGSATADASPTKFLIGCAALGLLALIPVFFRKRKASGATPVSGPGASDSG